MKAMIIERNGGPEVFVERDLPIPLPNTGHIRVKIYATSVNPIDAKLRATALPFSKPLPTVLHVDLAGVVDAVGEGVTQFKVGDEVYGAGGGVRGAEGGSLAEYSIVDAKLLALKPKSLSFREAAVLPLVAITAWEALVDKLQVKPNQKVLVHGGAGGVGHITLQLAKCLGAKVYTTVSKPAQIEIAKQLGADEVINYTSETVDAYVKRCTGGNGFDAVVDTVGGENLERSMEAVKIGGGVASISSGGLHDLTQAFIKGVSVHSVLMLIPMLINEGREHHGEILTQIAKLVDEKKIKPLIDPKEFSLKDISQAHAHLESGSAMGKIAVSIVS